MGAVVMIVEGGLLALALVFVLALLRSHAEILRRLAALEGGERPERGGRTEVGEAPTDARTVAGIAGSTPAGDAVAISLAGGAPATLLAFLSTGCAGCAPLWDELRNRRPVPAPARLVVVTKGTDRESPARVAALGPSHCEVVMSTPAWEDFGVPATPHFVLVGGEAGQVLGRGSAGNWDQILRLLDDARADAREPILGATSDPDARGRVPGATSDLPARESIAGSSSSDRAARAEAALAAAGIGEGHPSLYPSRGDQA